MKVMFHPKNKKMLLAGTKDQKLALTIPVASDTGGKLAAFLGQAPVRYCKATISEQGQLEIDVTSPIVGQTW